MKKKTLRPHIILAIEGRLFCLLISIGVWLLIFCTICFGGILELWLESKVSAILTVVFLICIGFIPICILPFFWQSCWGKIILLEDMVIWRCFLCRTVKIRYDEIHSVNLIPFKSGNVYKNKDYYNNGFLYLVISSRSLSNKRIDKIRSDKNTIKIPYHKKMGIALYDFLPDPYNRQFKYKTK